MSHSHIEQKSSPFQAHLRLVVLWCMHGLPDMVSGKLFHVTKWLLPVGKCLGLLVFLQTNFRKGTSVL